MKLIKYENNDITISDEAYLVKAFRDLFNADKSRTKENFFNQMSIIFFMKDPRSTYNYIVDKDEKLRTVLRQEGLPEDFRMTAMLKKAMDTYEQMLETPSTRLLKSAIEGAENLGATLSHIDFSAMDKNGKLVNLGASTLLENVPKIVRSLKDTQKMVEQEIEDKGRARGGNESKKTYEDGVDIDD